MSLYQKQEIVTQQKGKWPVRRLPSSMHVCMRLCECACVYVCVEGEISGGSGMITNCCIPQSGPLGLLELQN